MPRADRQETPIKENTMKLARLLTSAALVLGLSGPAVAASKASLAPGGRTVAGPGAVSLAPAAQERVFTDAAATSNVCVTLVNGGKSQLTLTITGATTPSADVAGGGTRALCAEDVQFVDVICSGPNSCSGQWRVDDN
jgi:hypothetical protein